MCSRLPVMAVAVGGIHFRFRFDNLANVNYLFAIQHWLNFILPLTVHWRYFVVIYLFVKRSYVLNLLHVILILTRINAFIAQRTAIWIPCVEINASSCLAPTTFVTENRLLPLKFCQNWHTLQRDLSAIAELLV